jgi:hypothetical protein
MWVMSEFRFNCPVCGQHIATDSSAGGAQIECPTCFQSIIVPQAPLAHTRYILSATQYIKPQPAPRLPPPSVPTVERRKYPAPRLFLTLFFGCVIGVVVYVIYSRSHHPGPGSGADPTRSVSGTSLNPDWRLNLEGVAFPDAGAAGRIHLKEFNCDHTYLQNGVLALRQGAGRPHEMTVNVYLPARESRELSGKGVIVETNDTGNMPRIAVRWKEGEAQVTELFTNGYAMKLEFGSIAADMISGKIYLCLPDVSRSFVAGNFNAEIRKLPLPKQP